MAPEPDWLTTRKAAEYLSISVYTLRGSNRSSKTIRTAIRQKIRGEDYRAGVLWFREDLEAIVAVRKLFGIRTAPAARLVMNAGRAQKRKCSPVYGR
jgi:hypothetical protein